MSNREIVEAYKERLSTDEGREEMNDETAALCKEIEEKLTDCYLRIGAQADLAKERDGNDEFRSAAQLAGAVRIAHHAFRAAWDHYASDLRPREMLVIATVIDPSDDGDGPAKNDA